MMLPLLSQPPDTYTCYYNYNKFITTSFNNGPFSVVAHQVDLQHPLSLNLNEQVMEGIQFKFGPSTITRSRQRDQQIVNVKESSTNELVKRDYHLRQMSLV